GNRNALNAVRLTVGHTLYLSGSADGGWYGSHPGSTTRRPAFVRPGPGRPAAPGGRTSSTGQDRPRWA
ncbi:hypothetical protein AB0I39_06475, partial [Kitasatospora purpeofusca]|uniref:hypothetical protein n=1 Tax=Kitasatospora purpeofusca TaxID=67352 RepID=UPI0033E09DAE